MPSMIMATSQLLITLAISLFSIISFVNVVEANTIISSIEKELEFDENGKLSNYHFVYPATQNPNCVDKIIHNENVAEAHFQEGGLKGEALSRVFPDYKEVEDEGDDSRCMAACLEKGTDASVAGYTVPQLRYDSSSSSSSNGDYDMQVWFRRSCKMVEVCFINYVSQTEPLSIYWIDARNGKLSKQLDLEYGESGAHCADSFLGHEFVAVLESNRFVERITIEHATTKTFGERPLLSPSHQFDNSSIKPDLEVKKTLEHDLAKLFVDQPNAFSSSSSSSLSEFTKGRLPDDIFANIGAFYYNNRANVVNEQQWDGEGSFANWWETNVKVVSIIPWKLKETWQTRLNALGSAAIIDNNTNDNENSTGERSSSSSSPSKRKTPPPKRRPRNRTKNINMYAAAPTYAPTSR